MGILRTGSLGASLWQHQSDSYDLCTFDLFSTYLLHLIIEFKKYYLNSHGGIMRGILPLSLLLLFSLAYTPLLTHGRRRTAICTPTGDSGLLISSNVSVIDLERAYCCKLVDPSSTYISYNS